MFELYCSITSRVRDVFRRRDRACLAETNFALASSRLCGEGLTHAFEIDKPSFWLFRFHHGTKHARFIAGYFCVPALVDDRISPRTSRIRKKSTPISDRCTGKQHPVRKLRNLDQPREKLLLLTLARG